MDIQKEDITRELDRIKEKMNKSTPLCEEDLKIILLSVLAEEDHYEDK